ncbi:glycosyltransferase [Lactobacillaceae bacterium 24-114]
MKKTFALTGDYAYITPITTTIKSVLYHNPSSTIYLVNSDIPQEWFKTVNQQLRNSGNHIIDIKIEPSYLNQEHVGLEHIQPIAYGKILLPELLKEDRVVYLDSDLIVTNTLDSLFNLNLQGHTIACSLDVDENNGNFNTGVIVYDLKKARSIPNLVQEELEIGQNRELRNADQDVMNKYFGTDFYKLPLDYNYQIGMDWIAFYNHHDYFYDLMNPIKDPKIIHYLTPDKPWKTVSTSRFRETWWQYFALTFNDVINHAPLPNLDLTYKGKFFTFITTQNMGNLPQLIQRMPNYQFNIGAWSLLGEPVMKLLAFENVRLYPMITGPQLEQLKLDCDAYLDINEDGKEQKVIDIFEKEDKPIFSFYNVAHNQNNYSQYHIFEDNDLDGMIKKLAEL